jgi:hypothetical protein
MVLWAMRHLLAFPEHDDAETDWQGLGGVPP